MWGKERGKKWKKGAGKKGRREGRKECCDIISHFPKFISVPVDTENKLTHSDSGVNKCPPNFIMF